MAVEGVCSFILACLWCRGKVLVSFLILGSWPCLQTIECQWPWRSWVFCIVIMSWSTRFFTNSFQSNLLLDFVYFGTASLLRQYTNHGRHHFWSGRGGPGFNIKLLSFLPISLVIHKHCTHCWLGFSHASMSCKDACAEWQCVWHNGTFQHSVLKSAQPDAFGVALWVLLPPRG